MIHFRSALRVIIAIAFAAVGLLSPVSGVTAQPPDPDNLAALAASLQSDFAARIAYHPQTGKVRFIGVDPGRPIRNPIAQAYRLTPEDAGMAFFTAYAPLFGLKNAAAELQSKDVTLESDGRRIISYQQLYQGVPVFGGELLLHLDRSSAIVALIGETSPDLTLSVQPKLGADDARRIALGAAEKYYPQAAGRLLASQPQLWVYDPALITTSGPRRLVWRLEVTTTNALEPIRELVLVDADTGGLALHFNQIADALNRETYDLNHYTTLPGTLACNESNPTCSGGIADAQDAHRFAADAYNFYSIYHSRDSIDGAGMTIKSSVRYSSGYANAFWTGIQMVYGDGYGFVHADDIVGHELTHGVTQHESGLFYYAQSGAINESFSDVWGELIDQWNGTGNDDVSVRWLIGEDSTGMPNTWKRNMQNPTGGGIYDTQPDRMSSPFYYLGEDDNAGVHTNSGINNKAAYLMTDGGTFNSYTVTGLGLAKVAAIYYEAQTNLMTAGADYPDLYDALYQACLNLVGGNGIRMGDCQQVRNATLAVEMNQLPSSVILPAAICPADKTFGTSLFEDDFESGDGNWAFYGSDTSHWRLSDMFPRSFSYSLWGDDFPDQISDSYAAMNTSVLLPANAYLHFAHAYLFEEGNYDGGVLEYSTDTGATWTDAGSLIEVNGYNGALTNAYGNPLGGQTAFVSASLGANGYIASRVNLSSLSGQSVRFRWRMGLDSDYYNWGWFIDDVSIHTCVVDTQAPTVTLDRGVGFADLTNLRPVVFRVTFSEPVTGFTSSDVVGGGTSGAYLEQVVEVAPNDGTTYDVRVDGMTNAGTVTLTFGVGAAVDLFGNPSTAPTIIDNSIYFITTNHPTYLPLMLR